MRNGRGVDREMKVVQGVKNEGSANRKSLHAVQKGECEGKREERSLEKSLEIGFETRKDEKKVDFTGQKTSAIS